MRRLLVVAVAAIALSGCGSDEANIVRGALENDIKSAQVEITFVSSENGVDRRITLAGPYRSNGEGKLPGLDLKVETTGMMQQLAGRLVTTEKNAFIVYDGETYEVGEGEIAKLREKGDARELDLNSLMGKMRDWFPDTERPVPATLDGEPVTRVSGLLNLTEALKDLNGMSGQPGFEQLKPVDKEKIKTLAKAVKNPRFTLDVGRDDGKLRRLVASAHVDNEGRSGELRFSLRFKDIDKPVTIDAPTSGKPIKALGEKFLDDTGVNELASDSQADVQLRLIALKDYQTTVAAINRWAGEMKRLQDEDQEAAKTRDLAQVLGQALSDIEQAPAESPEFKDKRQALLEALTDLRDAADKLAVEMNSDRSARVYDRVAGEFEDAANGYDDAMEPFAIGR